MSSGAEVAHEVVEDVLGDELRAALESSSETARAQAKRGEGVAFIAQLRAALPRQEWANVHTVVPRYSVTVDKQ